jgi:hypothetical protein
LIKLQNQLNREKITFSRNNAGPIGHPWGGRVEKRRRKMKRRRRRRRSGEREDNEDYKDNENHKRKIMRKNATIKDMKKYFPKKI